jgi:hypothetical protein
MDNENKNSYIWLVALVILAVLVCIFIKSPESQKEKEVEQEIKVPVKEKSEFRPQVQQEDKSLYEKLNPKINIAIKQLQRKAHEAKRIIPYFPDFPNLWLLPYKDKGAYGSIPERYCIEFLHLLFPQHTFIKQKHSWLRNTKTNYPLELDAFCSELMIALEYNGIQHYVWPNYFHSTIDQFFAQRDRDQLKEEICIKENICLIRISYLVELERIPLAIYSKLLEAVPGLNLKNI